MTEEEAKTKTCCGPIPVLMGILVTVHPNERSIPGALCVASQCMAWRVAKVGRVLPGDEYATYTTEGYCGLAGPVQ